MSNRTVAELEAALAIAKEREKAEAERYAAKLKASTPVIYKYEIVPHFDGHYEIMDDSCVIYFLQGTITNKEAAQAAGHRVDFEGGMAFLYNEKSGKLVMRLGGGNIHVSDGGFGASPGSKITYRVTIEKINAFLLDNPLGGDITEIVNDHKARLASLNAE